MIGVIANPSDLVVVTEFFELFKTPWEIYRRDREYDVLVCAGDGRLPEQSAKVVVVYAGQELPFDVERDAPVGSRRKEPCVLLYKGNPVPIYGESVTFLGKEETALLDEDSHQPAIKLVPSEDRLLARVGYDLFREMRFLLTQGQPAANAGIPALEWHIAILRDLIVGGGVELVEIPPVPEGYRFIACLTHDVDHPSIRLHKFDHTTLGFLYRAIVGSVVNVLRGRSSVRTLLGNWAAALKLPFVHIGLAKDDWSAFDRYPTLERGVRSSFFLIPFKDDPGLKDGRPAPKRRASRYGASDFAGQIQTLMAEGCEIGLHGIDAWRDSSKGRQELEEIRGITSIEAVGVRMHWLYFGEQSPAILEQAGADYDSTVGYNETVGYRSGTTQVYKPLETTRLLELPLHIMDTAMFFPTHLDLSPKEARRRVGRIIDNAVQFGGTVTVNWHDRSIAPERCWRDSYLDLIEELKSKGAWFATATETVSWFRKRRSATFENFDGEASYVQKGAGGDLPGLHLRVFTKPSTIRSHQVEAAVLGR